MLKKLDDLLCQQYPSIFRDRHADPTKTGMCWGFTCGDGWFGIIDRLCAEISRQVESGAMPDVVATQVKEKMGTLRFRFKGGNEETYRLVELALEESATTVEEE